MPAYRNIPLQLKNAPDCVPVVEILGKRKFPYNHLSYRQKEIVLENKAIQTYYFVFFEELAWGWIVDGNVQDRICFESEMDQANVTELSGAKVVRESVLFSEKK
jgi:hypothetical protein